MKTTPLFICHANCARSVLAEHLYRQLTKHHALSAGLEPGEAINRRTLNMLLKWGVDASNHKPQKVTRELCEDAHSIFVMGPKYLKILLSEVGNEVCRKTYLFADPFSTPRSFNKHEYLVKDPSFMKDKTKDLIKQFSWMRERVLQIRLAILQDGHLMIPAQEYLDLLKAA